MRLRHISGLVLLTSALTPLGGMALAADTPAAQNQPAAPQYDPTADSIIKGLKGVASGAQATLDNYRDNARSKKIQDALEAAIDAAIEQEDAKSKTPPKPEDAKPADGAAKPIEPPKPTASVMLTLSDVAILCDVREEYARAKAYADDITSFTGAFDQVATPTPVTSLGTAITSLLATYKLDLSGTGKTVLPDATRNACIADLRTWADDYYRKRVITKDEKGALVLTAAVTATPATTGIDTLFGDLSAISGVIGAVINIITPIIENVATTSSQEKRQKLIDSKLADPQWDVSQGFGQSDKKLGENEKIKSVLDEARTALTMTNMLADKARHVALGQFMEKLEALRETQIDLTTLKAGKDACTDALKTHWSESENIGGDLATSATTPARSTTLYYKTVPGWLDKDFNISGVKVPDGAGKLIVDSLSRPTDDPPLVKLKPMDPNPIPAKTTVKAVSDAIVTMSNPTKSAFAKGTTIWIVSATDKNVYVGLPTSEPAKAGDKTLHFSAATAWPKWATAGAKIAEPSNDKIALDTKMTALTEPTVEISNPTTAEIPPSAQIQYTFSTASRTYMSCFAQAVNKISVAVNDAVKMAKAYDTAALAQASTDDLKKQIDGLQKASQKDWPWPASNNPSEAQAAGELIAFGASMQNAFSKDNITALQNALDAVKKAF